MYSFLNRLFFILFYFIHKSQHLQAVISVFVSCLTLPSTMLYHDVFESKEEEEEVEADVQLFFFCFVFFPENFYMIY